MRSENKSLRPSPNTFAVVAELVGIRAEDQHARSVARLERGQVSRQHPALTGGQRCADRERERDAVAEHQAREIEIRRAGATTARNYAWGTVIARNLMPQLELSPL